MPDPLAESTPGAGPATGDLADRDLLIDIGRTAGDLAMGYFGGTLEVREKPGEGPVSEADLAVDRLLEERLRAARPAYGWLSEESADSDARLGAGRVFLVDPIDGTRAFIAGEKGWSVALAVVEAGMVRAAAVVLPARGEIYAAALGAGATLDGAAIAGSTRAVTDGATMLAAKPTLAPEHWPGGVPSVKRTLRSSLAWRLCLVAAGRFDTLLTVRPCWEWDVAAGSLIAAEAGIAVSDAIGAPLVFNRLPPRTPGLMAVPRAMQAEMLTRRGQRRGA
ncbi:MAG: 3'(2'),5'-bisphosphate nucleotidase CysQ [Pseudomonadota bacterium]